MKITLNWLRQYVDIPWTPEELTERLTMLDANTIHYALTLEDPNVYTRPWTIAWALVRVTEPGFQLIEEACREGERTVGDLHTRGYKYYFGAPWRARGRR